MQSKTAKLLWIFAIILIFSTALYRRVTLFHQVGGDMGTYIEAMDTFLGGDNPYKDTVESFEHLESNPGGKGFSYLPGLLYINTVPYSTHMFISNLFPCNPLLKTGFCTDLIYFWKVPILLADLGVGILILKILGRKNKFAALFATAFWFFNPFMHLKNDFITNDPITIFFMLLSLYYLGKDEVASGASYALAVGTKTFPILLLPVMLLKSSNKKNFILSAAFVGLALSVPFLTSVNDFTTYVTGAVLVHGDRFMQGRPFLFYISYWLSIEFFQIVSLKTYTAIASFGGWVLSIALYYFRFFRDKYFLSLVSFVVFYIFTPVLNRTYLLWFFPIFLIGLYNFFSKRFTFKGSKYLFYATSIMFWGFYYWYLAQWQDGFHIHKKI